MTIIFLGTQYPPCNNTFIEHTKTMPQYAADKVSRLFLEGLAENLEEPIYLINMPPVADWPLGHKDAFIAGYQWKNGLIECNSVGFLNLTYIRQFTRTKTVAKALTSCVRKLGEKKITVIAYSMCLPFLYAMYTAKKQNPQIKTCLIVPDLPNYMNLNPSTLYSLFKGAEIKKQYKLLESVDCFVLFTKYMAEVLPIGAKPWITIEGICDVVQAPDVFPSGQRKIILYTGVISNHYGIGLLLDAFSFINDPQVYLYIAGDGESRALVEEAARKNNRIIYLGTKPNYEINTLQKEATILVNPRTNEGDYTKYSFPSKIIEYMASGTPVILFKLAGIPDEYDKYLKYFSCTTPRVMADEMLELCNLPEDIRFQIGKKAANFVYNYKNKKYQTKKIIELLDLEV